MNNNDNTFSKVYKYDVPNKDLIIENLKYEREDKENLLKKSFNLLCAPDLTTENNDLTENISASFNKINNVNITKSPTIIKKLLDNECIEVLELIKDKDISIRNEDDIKKLLENDENLKVPKEVEELENNDIPNMYHRSCLGRWFSLIKGGSLRGSTFALASVTFGGGCLAFPKAMADSGLLLGLIIFFMSALLSYITMRYLIDIGIRKRILDYNELVRQSTNDYLRIFADINNIILCFGVIMQYQFTIYKFMFDIFKKDFDLELTEFYKVLVIIICVTIIQIPLSLLKNVSVLQYASITATFSLIYAIIVIVIECPFYYNNYIETHPGFEFSLIKKNLGFKWLNTVGVFLFGFCCHNGIFQVFMEMDRPNLRRSIKVGNRAISLEVVLYLSISIAGYISRFDDCDSTFLVRPDLLKIDYFMDVAKITLIICLNCVMAINYNIMRLSVYSLVFKGEHPSYIIDFVITVLTYLITNVIVYFVKSATDILGFVGGISTVVISFICPILVDIKLGSNHKFHWRNIFNYVVMIVITLLGVASTANAIYNFIDGN